MAVAGCFWHSTAVVIIITLIHVEVLLALAVGALVWVWLVNSNGLEQVFGLNIRVFGMFQTKNGCPKECFFVTKERCSNCHVFHHLPRPVASPRSSPPDAPLRAATCMHSPSRKQRTCYPTLTDSLNDAPPQSSCSVQLHHLPVRARLKTNSELNVLLPAWSDARPHLRVPVVERASWRLLQRWLRA